MPDQPSGFTVTDRRKFTLEGDLREGTAPAEETQKSEPKPDSHSDQKLGPQLVQNAPPAERDVEKEVDKEVQKEVVDRDLEPLPAEEEADDEPPTPTAAESAQQDADYRASAKKLDDMISQANPGAREAVGRSAEMTFDKLVQSIYMTAALQMGAGTQPGEQPRVDIVGARQSIDMLSVLTEKTKGNLTEKEQRLLQNALFELRMMFMEITNAISSSAHNPSARPPTR
jgi:hypothetical protein